MKTFILITFSLLLTCHVCSQDLSQTYMYANTQLSMGNLQSAIPAFHRVLFFSPLGEDDGSYRGDSYRQLGNCYFELNDYDKAASYYDLAYFSSSNDSVKIEMLFKKTQCLLLMNDYRFALVELLGLDDSLDGYFQRRKDFYLGISYFGLNQFEKSELYFLNSIDDTFKEEKYVIEGLFKKNEKIDRLNPKTAKILSMILPGLGQFYSGDVKNGLNSLVLTSAFLLIGINTALSYSIFDAVFAIMPWYQRYYIGGVKKAEAIARKKVRKKRSGVYHEIIDTIASIKERIE